MTRSTVAEININNLRYNLSQIKHFLNNSKIMAVVKANAYGHGIVEITRNLVEEGVDFFAVAFADEAEMIRKAGIDKDIVILVPGNSIDSRLFPEYNLQALASSYDFIKNISDQAALMKRTVKVHLNIDTGMNRDGILPSEAEEYYRIFSEMPYINVAGICTHFSSAPTDREFTLKQLQSFNEIIDRFKANGCEFEYIHAANSAGMINYPESHFTHVRPGISLYGLLPDESLYTKIDLKPLLTLKTKVNITRRIKPGDSVGYDRLFIAEKETTIATIPVGYGDGYFKTLTGKAECLIKGKRYKLVGTVCMDQCMVDVGDDDIRYGDEVILLGRNGKDEISVHELAEKAGTIPYEITSNLNLRVPRKYVNGKM